MDSGAKGQLGSAVREMLEQGGAHELLTTDRDVDITDLERVCAYTDGNAPDVIINCAGLTDLAVCERHVEDAYRVNALGARNLAIAAKRTDAKLIHISTDDVFDGTAKKPLTEFDHVNPRTVYGKSKLAGEDFVRELASRHVIVRSSWIYGDTKNNFVSYILEGLLTEDTIFVPVDQVSTPTSARSWPVSDEADRFLGVRDLPRLLRGYVQPVRVRQGDRAAFRQAGEHRAPDGGRQSFHGEPPPVYASG